MSKKYIFIISCVIIIVGVIGFWFWRESMFSKEILKFEILGPETAKAGEEITYTVKYKNNGNFVLQNPKLVFNMPDNSLTEDSKIMSSQSLEDIYPGAEKTVIIKTRLLGKEGDLKVAKASLSYTPKNLTAPFESNTTFTTKISEVPITLDFDLPTKIEKGKDLQYSINYFSNIDYPLENLSVKINTLQGFSFVSVDPDSLDNSEWKIPTLNKAEGGRITIKGKVDAETNQNLEFSAQIGMWQKGNFIVIKEANTNIQIIQPLLYISQLVNGSSDYVASPGETLHYQIFFRNIGSSAFDDLFIITKLNGLAVDLSSVQPGTGQVQTNDNMIVWDYKQTPQLRYLDEQEEASVDFYVKVKNDWSPSSSDENSLTISNEVNISQIVQKFSIKVNSGMVISQDATYDSENKYTINWNIKNYFSDIKNVKVKAVLPQNVNLTGQIMPENESSNFTFDSASREIVWSAGDILSGTGVNGDPVALSFQISVATPDSQNLLIEKAIISGENQFTNTTITSTAPGISISSVLQ